MAAMVSRVCICCGERMPEQGIGLSDNPNVCAACSTIEDGTEEAGTQPQEDPAQALHLQAEPPEPLRRAA
jgi:hypothetical protein